MSTDTSHAPVLVTLPRAAREIGIQYRQLLEAVKAGEVPHYRIQKSRMLVSVPEVISFLKQPNMKGNEQ